MTARQRKGWKVISSSNEGSCFVRDYSMVYYSKRRKTFPKKYCGPLCVFKSKKTAEMFVRKFIYPTIIVKCFYKPSPSKYVWKTKRKLSRTSLLSLPAGTALADSVTCLE